MYYSRLPVRRLLSTNFWEFATSKSIPKRFICFPLIYYWKVSLLVLLVVERAILSLFMIPLDPFNWLRGWNLCSPRCSDLLHKLYKYKLPPYISRLRNEIYAPFYTKKMTFLKRKKYEDNHFRSAFHQKSAQSAKFLISKDIRVIKDAHILNIFLLEVEAGKRERET